MSDKVKTTHVYIHLKLWMRLTEWVSMMLRATWWHLYSSCLRSTWLWNRGCFLTGSSGPNCGETTLSTGVQESEKTKGLNIDLAEDRRETKRIFIHPLHADVRKKSGGERDCSQYITNQFTGTRFRFKYIYRRCKGSHSGQRDHNRERRKGGDLRQIRTTAPKQPSTI